MTVRIRPAVLGDLDALVDLERAAFADPWSRESLRTELAGDSRRMPLVACDGDDLVGVALIWVVADELHLVSLAVRPDRRREGIAQALLDAALASEAGRRASIMTLEVRAGNAGAIALYRRNGFVDVALRPHYYPDTDEDALVMLKSLRSPGSAADS